MKKANAPEVAGLFRQLVERAEVYARLHEEYLEGIIKHREARTGKKVQHTKRQAKMLEGFDKDAEQAIRDMETGIATMDDRQLLISALSGEYQQLDLDERMFPYATAEDQPMARRLLDFRRETIQLIEGFVESSSFKGKVVSLWKSKRQEKRT